MNAIQLQRPDGTPTTVWICGECGRTCDCLGGNPAREWDEEASDSNRKSAERCCSTTCEKCGHVGEMVGWSQGLCSKCRAAHWAATAPPPPPPIPPDARVVVWAFSPDMANNKGEVIFKNLYDIDEHIEHYLSGYWSDRPTMTGMSLSIERRVIAGREAAEIWDDLRGLEVVE